MACITEFLLTPTLQCFLFPRLACLYHALTCAVCRRIWCVRGGNAVCLLFPVLLFFVALHSIIILSNISRVVLQVANGSMIADVPMLMDMLTGDDSAELESLRLVRAGRAAKAGARAGRIFRLIRVIRLVRVFKLLKLASKLRKQREQGQDGKDFQAQNSQNLSNVGLRMMARQNVLQL